MVFDNGLTADWYDLQNQLSPLTRVCSYDPARQAGPLGRSDPAPGPRTGIDRVRDLTARPTKPRRQQKKHHQLPVAARE